MLQVIMRIIFKPYRSRRHPLGVFLCNPLLGNQSHLNLLSLPQFTDQRTLAIRIRDDWIPHPLVRPLAAHHQIARIHAHNVVAGAARMQ